MRPLKHVFILLLLSVTPVNLANAFTFDFGDNDYHPYWGSPYYRPVSPYFYMPQLPMYDRSTLVRRRQEQMNHNADAMTELRELLYGGGGFDRAEAIRLAKKIELASGRALSQNFHPGAVRDMHSHTTPAYWGNEDTFKTNALALQQAARDLAGELEKKPSEAQGGVFLNRRWRTDGNKRAAVSPGVWDKYNRLAETCSSCHHSFRGPSW